LSTRGALGLRRALKPASYAELGSPPGPGLSESARNLFHALDLPSATSVPIDQTLREELTEGRDLHEHWVENMPKFNVTPRVEQPKHRTGKSFAARNPDRGPYWWLGWSNKTGAQLLPNVPAPAVHELLDAVEAEVLANDGALTRFVPPRAPSPWLHEDGEWWPKAPDLEPT
jgi:hypothetical protein